jgi:hypothetical protein
MRYSSRGAREAIATIVKVAGICTSNIKAEELDSSLAGCGSGRWHRTNGGGSGGGKHQQQQEGSRSCGNLAYCGGYCGSAQAGSLVMSVLRRNTVVRWRAVRHVMPCSKPWIPLIVLAPSKLHSQLFARC